jgi:hypothetical protein
VRDRVLQNPNCVTALEYRLSYNVAVRVRATRKNDEPVAFTGRAAVPRRAGARVFRAGLLVVGLLGIGVLAAACGGGSSGSGVAKLGATTTTTVPSAGGPKTATKASDEALRFIGCLRTHGEPNMPDPDISGNHVSINIGASSGVNPNSPQFAAAYNACKHLLPNGGAAKGSRITSADQADYLKAAACMRSHGIPNFPDPTFADNSVEFNARTPIDANSPQYKSALETCQKLIPAGLPYSSGSAS